jgi:pimeloyl-ACP methyl ester carboxylesterase
VIANVLEVADPDPLYWQTTEDEDYRAPTADGWHLALYRYRPPAHAGDRPPVLAGHGLCGSHWIFDLAPDVSLARYLAGRGFDVWLVDWRGRGESWPPGGPDPTLQWDFDDFVFTDVPAAVAAVLAETGADGFWWLGTEMSGILLYASVLAGTATGVLGGVTCGSPAVTPPEGQVPGVITPFPEPAGGRYPFSMVRDVGPQLAREQSPALESSFRPANTDWEVTARYFLNGVPDESTAIVGQFKDWMAEGVMRSRAGDVWSDRLHEFRLPVLLLAGAADLQRPAEAVRATYEALGSPDKTFVRAGTADGFPVDFGHDDLLAGRDAPASVFPLIADWLDARS